MGSKYLIIIITSLKKIDTFYFSKSLTNGNCDEEYNINII